MRLATGFVVAALVAVTACGTDGGTPPQASPSRTITVERAAKVAAAGVLRPAELPGWQAGKAEDAGDSENDQYGTCLRSFDDYLAARTREFTKGRVTVTSYSGVAATAGQVAAEAAYGTSAEFRTCFERFLTALFAAGDRLAVVKYASRPVPVRVAGAADTYALSVRLTAEKRGVDVPLRVLFAGATTGHASVQVLAVAVATEPPSMATLARLLAQGVARARAAERAPGSL